MFNDHFLFIYLFDLLFSLIIGSSQDLFYLKNPSLNLSFQWNILILYWSISILMNVVYWYVYSYTRYHFRYNDNCFHCTKLSRGLLHLSMSHIKAIVSVHLHLLSFSVSLYRHCIWWERKRERERIYVRCTLKIFSLLFSSLHFVAFVSILNAVNFFSVSFVRPVKYNLHLMSLQITIRSVQLSVFYIIFLFLSILLERYLLVL